ncbi:hypothetical protein LTR09_005742 [Extremus antarcticus]|uniref:Manganese/iron superoxide dismutase C-terminal domain-containing protein n=1 Tax=Extremus antarcticus TaxID=702011 RepID=A0AAJ0DG04_9PEZI|nr:hypothetical protein LTR09_005742 [Extremus antarcticus]
MITRRLARPLGAISSSNWVCPSCVRRLSSAQAYHTAPPKRASLLQQRFTGVQRRKLHNVPDLAQYDDSFKRNGVPGLWSPIGFQIAWTQYQHMVVRKLNELTSGEPYENAQPKDLAIQFARDPSAASLFNHASAAHNNHQFLKGLSTSPMQLDTIPRMQKTLENTFGSIDTLRTTFIDTAASMFGPGYVWLVWVRDLSPTTVSRGDWRILTTYLAGTPYPEAGFRHQGIDTNVSNAQKYNDYLASEPTNHVGAFGPSSKTGKETASIPPGGKSLMPVLCVSTWEHSYIYDFGLPGRMDFLQSWWDIIDWKIVEQLTPEEVWTEFDVGLGSLGARQYGSGARS